MREQAAQGREHAPIYRKLKPGPGRSADEVLANQCARLCGAMIQLVGEDGYERATVRALSQLAGVSTKTFYRCFDNVEECFARTYDRLVKDTFARAARFTAGHAEERLRGRTRALFKSLGRDPRAARLVLLESFSAGSAVEEKARAASRAFELLVRDEFAMPPDPVHIPPVMAHGIVGAAVRVARTRLLADPPADPEAIADSFADWLLAFRDARLAKLCGRNAGHGLGGLALAPPSPPIGDDRQFLLTAVAKLSMADGYASLTVPAIRREAGVSRRSFDVNFEGVPDCFLAAVEARVQGVAARAQREASGAASWVQGVARMTALLLGELARDPELARLGFTEIFAPGRPGLELRESIVTHWARRLYRSAPEGESYTELAAEASIAASWSMAKAEAEVGRADRIAKLVPTTAFVILAPAIGPGQAERAIVAELRPREDREEVRRHLPQPS